MYLCTLLRFATAWRGFAWRSVAQVTRLTTLVAPSCSFRHFLCDYGVPLSVGMSFHLFT